MGFRKLIAVALCFTALALTGCANTGGETVDAGGQVDGLPIIEYKDVKLYNHDVEKKMNYYLTQQNMTIEDLSEGSDVEIWERFKHDIVFELSMFQIALDHAAELGLDQLTPEETSSVEEAYKIGMSTAEGVAKTATETALKNDDSLDNTEEYNKQLSDYFFLHGYDLDTYKEELTQELIVGKVEEYYTRDITVTDDEVKEKYEYELEVQTNNIAQQPSAIEQNLLFGAQILYYPQGYMYARHILVSFEAATRGAAAIAYVNGNISEYNRIINEAVPTVQARVEEIQSKLAAGEDFATVMEQYSDDKTLNEEPYFTNGFLIGPYSQFDITEYLDAVATLEHAGDISGPVPTYMGVYIIECVKPLGGPVPFEDISESLRNTMIEQKKAYTWSSLGESWIEQAENEGILQTYLDRI